MLKQENSIDDEVLNGVTGGTTPTVIENIMRGRDRKFSSASTTPDVTVVTHMYCWGCGNQADWAGDYVGKTCNCPACGEAKFNGCP